MYNKRLDLLHRGETRKRTFRPTFDYITLLKFKNKCTSDEFGVWCKLEIEET